MAKSLFVAATALNSGLTSVCLGLVQALERVGVKVGFYKPFSQSVHRAESLHNAGRDLSVTYIRDHSHLETPDPIPLKRAQQMLNRQQADLLMETVVGHFQHMASRYDVVVIEGLVPGPGRGLYRPTECRGRPEPGRGSDPGVRARSAYRPGA